MNLISLEYFQTNKTQNMDLNALLSEKIETKFFAMTRCSLPHKTDIVEKLATLQVREKVKNLLLHREGWGQEN